MFYYIIAVIVIAVLISFVYAGLSGAPWVPTRKKDVRRFIEVAKIRPGEVMYDIGCGDGRLVVAAAASGANARGLEISLLPYALAKVRVFFSRSQFKSRIIYKNLWRADLSDADVLYVWLMPSSMPRLKQKFELELRPGTRVVTYIWPIKGWKPKKISKQKNGADIFLYEM